MPDRVGGGNPTGAEGGEVGSVPCPIPANSTFGTLAIQSDGPRAAQTRAPVRSPATLSARIPGEPKATMSVASVCRAASPQTTEP